MGKSNNSLLVVTWDEDDGAQNNQVPAILYGADITPGLYNTPYNHYNLLSAIATAESVTGPNNAATASPITGIYNTPTCFVSGTRILTERGEVAVEDLREGDRVVTVEDEGQTVRQVRWIGHRQIDLAIHPDPEMMSPIRIRCDAIGENIPHRDLLVSADHAIFIDGKLIPARMLVNGTTIVKETCARKVHYFHIELDRHSVLFAEGLTAESYLDTGNRTFFTNGGLTLALHPQPSIGSGLSAYARNGCAPLAISEPEVRPIWERLSARAAALNCPVVLPNTTNDAALRLVVDDRAFRPIVIDDGWYVFPLPRCVGSVRLASRSASPTASRPWLDDRRRLGVCVERIFLQTLSGVAEIPMDHPDLRRGWHAAERQGDRPCRWTDGEAALPLPATAFEGGVLKVRVASAASYPLEMPVRSAPARDGGAASAAA